ncbi:MAG: hypothetical protein K2Q12_05785 [Rickettsiales bacterium]|nr:hypothetical protein [Rickettsiales bacterium]
MMSVQIGAENDTRWFSGNYATILVFGGNSGNQETYIPVLTAEEAFNIDEKMDDGKPGIGTVRGFKFNLCVNPDSASTAAQKQAATYDRTLASRNCSLIFSLAGDPG